MKKFALMLASFMMAGTIFGVCACGGDNTTNPDKPGDNTQTEQDKDKDNPTTDTPAIPEIEGSFTKEATAEEIKAAGDKIDLQKSVLGANATAWTLNGKLTESLDVSGDIKLTIKNPSFGTKVYPIKATAKEGLTYLANASYTEANGVDLKGNGNISLSLDGTAPAFALDYIKYALGELKAEPTLNKDTDTEKTDAIKLNAEANVYNLYNKSANDLYAEVKTAKYQLGTEAEKDFLATDGFLKGNAKLHADLAELMGGGYAMATAEGPAEAYTLGTVLGMAQEKLGGKVYLDTAQGLKVKVTFKVTDLAKGIYDLIAGRAEYAEGENEEENMLDTILDGFTFAKESIEITLAFDADNTFQKAAIALDVDVTKLDLTFGDPDGEESTKVEGKGTLKFGIGVERTTETVKPFEGLDKYTDVTTLFGGSNNDAPAGDTNNKEQA